MSDYKFISYTINGAKVESEFTYETYKEVFDFVMKHVIKMNIVSSVDILCNGVKIEEINKEFRKVEKIKISAELNEWLTENPTIPKDSSSYDDLYGDSIFYSLFDVFTQIDAGKEEKLVETFGYCGNTRIAHLWLLLNPEEWEVGSEPKYYICIPEKDGSNGYLKKDRGLVFNSNLPTDDRYKWTLDEIEEHEVAKHLKHFMKEV